MKKIINLALSLAFFTACSSNVATNENPKKDFKFSKNELLKIEKIIVNDKSFEPKDAEEIPNISFDESKFYGYSGCNRFFGSYENGDNALKIGEAASTQMLCHPQSVMEFENAFLMNFKGEFKILNENDKLVLSNDIMKIYFK